MNTNVSIGAGKELLNMGIQGPGLAGLFFSPVESSNSAQDLGMHVTRAGVALLSAAQMGVGLARGIGLAPSRGVPRVAGGSQGADVLARPGRATTGFIDDATVVHHGKVVGRGTVDVRATVEAVESGKLTPRAVFENRESLLPKQAPGYYQEFVHPTPGVRGAGPQRIVRGEGGELYYTPDHYKTFIPVN